LFATLHELDQVGHHRLIKRNFNIVVFTRLPNRKDEVLVQFISGGSTSGISVSEGATAHIPPLMIKEVSRGQERMSPSPAE
jgi:hypothetical protein